MNDEGEFELLVLALIAPRAHPGFNVLNSGEIVIMGGEKIDLGAKIEPARGFITAKKPKTHCNDVFVFDVNSHTYMCASPQKTGPGYTFPKN